MNTLDTLRTWNDRHAAGTGAHVTEVARDNGALLRAAMRDNTSPAPAGQSAVQPRTTIRRPIQATECKPGQMLIPGDLSYAMVDTLIAQLNPCRYALRKTNGADISFFEVSEWKGRKYLRLLSGAPGDYQRHKMSLSMQYMAAKHLLDDVAGAVKLYADTHSVCAKCHSPLTDAESRARGLGPVCAGKVF